MKNSGLKLLSTLLLLSLFHHSVADEVTISLDGVTLNGELILAEEKQIADGLVLITHGTLAHNKMEIVTGLQELLADSGVSSLAINLSLGVENRHGSYDCEVTHRHHHTDAVAEMGAWLDWLEQQGASRIDLMGHSRGGNQVAWLMAEQDRPSIHKAVLIAPATWSAEKMHAGYQKRYQKPLAPIFEKALALVKAGKENAVINDTDFIYCPGTSVTAGSFVSNYREDPRRDTPSLLPKIVKPTLVVAGTEDNVVGPLESLVEPLANDRLQLLVIEGAGHFFRDLYLEELVEQVVEWLQQ